MQAESLETYARELPSLGCISIYEPGSQVMYYYLYRKSHGLHSQRRTGWIGRLGRSHHTQMVAYGASCGAYPLYLKDRRGFCSSQSYWSCWLLVVRMSGISRTVLRRQGTGNLHRAQLSLGPRVSRSGSPSAHRHVGELHPWITLTHPLCLGVIYHCTIDINTTDGVQIAISILQCSDSILLSLYKCTLSCRSKFGWYALLNY